MECKCYNVKVVFFHIWLGEERFFYVSLEYDRIVRKEN